MCAQQCGCVCSAGACAQGHLSGEPGLALPGTSLVQVTGGLCLPVLPFSEPRESKKKSLLTKHDFSFGKSFLSTLGHTDLALVLFWHHQKTFFGSIISYHVTEHHPLGSNQLFLMGLGMSMQFTERKTGYHLQFPSKHHRTENRPQIFKSL